MLKIVVPIMVVLFLTGCQSMDPPDQKEVEACDHISIAGEFENLGNFPFKAGMTALDAYEAGKRTYRFRGVQVERNGEPIESIHSTKGAAALAQFALEPCDIVWGVVGPF